MDDYLGSVPDAMRPALEDLRQRIRSLAPEAVESVSYGVATFKYRGRPLIYLGGFKKHCAIYGTSAGTLRFQPDEPPSDELLRTLIDARRAEIEAAPARKRR